MTSIDQAILHSFNLGSVYLMLLVSLVDAMLVKRFATWSTVAWLASMMLFMVSINGWLLLVWPEVDQLALRELQVLSGPVMGALSGLQLSMTLTSNRRDRLALQTWQFTGLTGVVLAMGVLLLDRHYQLPGAMLITGLQLCISAILCVRVALYGDQLGWVNAAGTAVGMVVVVAFYREALGTPMSAVLQVLCSVVVVAGLFAMVTLGRARLYPHTLILNRQQSDTPDFDPLTRLYSSRGIIRRMVKASKRYRFIETEGMVMVIKLLNAANMHKLYGPQGLNEAYIHLANRLQETVLGGADLVGRYYDGCYIVFGEMSHSYDEMHQLADNIRAALTAPMAINTPGQGDPAVAQVGIGIATLNYKTGHVDTALYEAQSAAESDL